MHFDIFGSSDRDVVSVVGGDNTIALGGGNDDLTIGLGDHSSTVDMGEGNDFVEILGGTNTINMGSGGNNLSIFRGDNTIQFSTGNSIVTAAINIAYDRANVDFDAGINASDLVFQIQPASSTGGANSEPAYEGYIEVSLRDTSDSLRLLASTRLSPAGVSTLVNGSPVDEFRFANGDVLLGEEIWDAVTAAPGGFVHFGTEAADILLGTEFDDRFYSGLGGDTLSGLGGDDTFLFSGIGDEANTISGGDGIDTIMGTDGYDEFRLSSLSLSDSIERVVSVNFSFETPDRVIATEADNHLDFSDTDFVGTIAVSGEGGNDTIIASNVVGTIGGIYIGGDGNDTFTTGAGLLEAFIGGGGDDTFIVEGDNQAGRLFFGDGGLGESGQSGFDVIYDATGGDNIKLEFLDHTNSIEEIRAEGVVWNNVIRGSETNNLLDFSSTSLINFFVIDGAGGDDTVIGTSHSQIISGGLGTDHLSDGAGQDLYLWGYGFGEETINQTNTDQTANDDLAMFFMSHENLWLAQVGDDLVLDYVGTEDQVIFENWYVDDTKKIGRIFDHEHEVVGANIELLVQEMAAFDPPAGGWDVIPANVVDSLAETMGNVWVPLNSSS